MKKLFFASLLSLLVSCISTSSSNNSFDNYTAYFSQKISSTETLTLFVNGKSKGVIPYSTNAPTCGSNVLTFPLENGTYSIEVKDAKNVVKSSTNVTLDEGSISISAGVGGSSIQTQNDCLLGHFM